MYDIKKNMPMEKRDVTGFQLQQGWRCAIPGKSDFSNFLKNSNNTND